MTHDKRLKVSVQRFFQRDFVVLFWRIDTVFIKKQSYDKYLLCKQNETKNLWARPR